MKVLGSLALVLVPLLSGWSASPEVATTACLTAPLARQDRSQPAQDPPGEQPARSSPEPVEVGSTPNVHRLGQLWFSGQFPPEDVAALAALGVKRVITLREEGELDWDEAAAVEAAGMEHVALGFRAPEAMNDVLLDRLRELLAEQEVPTLLHCKSANRVGGAWIPFRVLDQGVSLEQAVEEARTIGLSSEAFRERAEAYVQAHGAPRGGVRLPEGLNDRFRAGDLDVDEFIGRFEVESREVYAARHAVLEALGLRAGMRVADVGAGTGLFTFPISEAVGPRGWVYAVDIAPRFVEHVVALAEERHVTNVTGVLCPQTSVALPHESIDLAYVCDTYHHFAFPSRTLASLRSALVPGGRLVVIDFERIPGTSSDWVLEHVRGDRAIFRAEIEAAGFLFIRELDIAGLEENYALEFVKPKE